MSKKGFTLIELLVVVAVLALLASIVTSNLGGAREGARISNLLQAQSQFHTLLGSDLVVWLSFNEGSGTAVYDLSGYGNHGLLRNFNFNESSGWFNGISGEGSHVLKFDGIDDWIDNISRPLVGINPNVFTITGIINPKNHTSRFITPNSAGIDQWIGYVGSSQRLQVKIAESADTNERSRYSTTGSVPIDTWTHFAVAINNRNIKIYINGILNNEFDESINIANWSGNWRIGQRGNSSYWYEGEIADLRIYSRAMTAQEVKSIYAQTKDKYLADSQ